jgi:hypothetical protein
VGISYLAPPALLIRELHMKISLVCVSDCRNMANLERMVVSARPIISDAVLVAQTKDANTFREASKLFDFSIQTLPKGNADPDRDYAYSLASGDWILSLDDDEYLTDECKDYIGRIVHSKADVVWFDFKNLVDKVDIKDILGPDPHPRLWRKIPGLISWPPQAHTFPQIASPKQVFTRTQIVHDREYKDLEERHKIRGAYIDPQMQEVEQRFLAAVKQRLGKQ